MNKSTKLTSSLLAGTLLLVNGAPFVNPVVAKDAPVVAVQNQNNNVSAQLVEQDGKTYLSVLAHTDVTNVSVKVKVSNGQVITFKQASLKANETVMFQLNIKDVEAVKAAKAKSNKKTLPKTEVVRESLLLQGKAKGFNLNAVVSYDVEKVDPVAKVELKQPKEDESKNSEKEEVVKSELVDKKADSPAETTQPVVKETPKEAQPVVKETPKEAQPAVKETPKEVQPVVKETPKEVQPVVKETPKEAQPVVKETSKEVQPVVKETPKEVQPVVKETPKEAQPAVKETPKEVQSVVKETPKSEVAPKVSYTKAKVSATLQGSYDEVVAQEVFNQLNAHRVKHGLKPLSVAVELSAGTEVRVKEFAQKALSGKTGMSLHTRLDESQWYTAFGGYGNAKGENVAYSVHGSSGMMGFWKNSKVHNDNMLNPKYTKVLVKVFKHGSTYYGVQIFG